MADTRTLSADELARYARHITLPEVGILGQAKLKSASVLVVGTGGLGSPVCLYLAAAGVGRLGIVDFDRVDRSNLQRQILHGDHDVGRPKIDSATSSIHAINPHVKVDGYDVPLTASNAMQIVSDYDVVIDGTDNFATRYLVNDACVLLGKPNCYGSIFQFEGQASVFGFDGGPCYRCLYPSPPDPGLIPNCAEGGVLGVLPGLIGTIQATEAIKMIIGVGESLSGKLLLLDAMSMQFRRLAIQRDLNCPLCGPNPTIKELIDYEQFCGVKSECSLDEGDIEPSELQPRIRAGEDLCLLDVREPSENAIRNLGGVLIPLGELKMRLDELDRSKLIVVHCQRGGRSAKAVQLLRDEGFEKVLNLKGGIEAWPNSINESPPNT